MDSTAGRQLDERAALARALDLAARGPVTENPRVGCVLLAPGGGGPGGSRVLGEGWHRGAGTPHAEVAALADAVARGHGPREQGGDGALVGATAVVTLEPCRHTGRTGPCTRALLGAGVARVVVGAPDPTALAGGGAAELATAGVGVVPVDAAGDGEMGDGLRERAAELLRPWARAHRHRRPTVTWKYAATLDGFSAAPDGSSRWVTGPAARADVHSRRARHDAVVVGTGTVLADDPALTVRDATGGALPRQPLRVVVGRRDLPPDAQLLSPVAGSPAALHLRTRDPAGALSALWEHGVRSVWLEGGPTLATAFWRAGLVDDVVAHLAPALLGGGRGALGDLGATSIDDAVRLRLVSVHALGGDVVVIARPPDPAEPLAEQLADRLADQGEPNTHPQEVR